MMLLVCSDEVCIQHLLIFSEKKMKESSLLSSFNSFANAVLFDCGVFRF